MKSYTDAKNTGKRRFYIAFSIIICLLFVSSSWLSLSKFGVLNPISSGAGLARIMLKESDYIEIQRSPRVVLAQPDGRMWELYLERQGYAEHEDERMGGQVVIERDGKKERVFVSLNAYYAKWRWEK